MKVANQQPIGIFDSGVGGLTVASAINQLLPNEQIIYFGDTAHLPYGDKSVELIKYYSLKISEFLLKYNCKVILIACNSASANAFQTVVDEVKNNAIVINVIDPAVEHVTSLTNLTKIGIIGTKATINSRMYETRIQQINSKIKVVSRATPLLVPMIEEGFVFDDISNAIIRTYLTHNDLQDIEALILGCTHYPIIKNQIRKFYNFNVNVIDSSFVVADYLRKTLITNNLLAEQRNKSHIFYVSDYTETFEKIAEMFFNEKITLTKIDLWK